MLHLLIFVIFLFSYNGLLENWVILLIKAWHFRDLLPIFLALRLAVLTFFYKSKEIKFCIKKYILSYYVNFKIIQILLDREYNQMFFKRGDLNIDFLKNLFDF